MHDVNKPLEQDKIAWDGTDTRTNLDAIELPPLELSGDYRFRSLTKVDETLMCVIAKGLHFFFGSGESC